MAEPIAQPTNHTPCTLRITTDAVFAIGERPAFFAAFLVITNGHHVCGPTSWVVEDGQTEAHDDQSDPVPIAHLKEQKSVYVAAPTADPPVGRTR